MIEEIHFFLHVVNGIFIIIHNDFVVYLHLFEYKLQSMYKYSYTCKYISGIRTNIIVSSTYKK